MFMLCIYMCGACAIQNVLDCLGAKLHTRKCWLACQMAVERTGRSAAVTIAVRPASLGKIEGKIGGECTWKSMKRSHDDISQLFASSPQYSTAGVIGFLGRRVVHGNFNSSVAER